MKNVSIIGIDLAKNIFHVHGLSADGKTVLRQRCTARRLKELAAQIPPCLVGMEACCGSNYWGRYFRKWGHEVRLMSPQFVKPFVKSNKNDRNDAEAIAEAVTRPNMRFVAIKERLHQDIQMVHRIRERLVKTRTGLINELRGLLFECGVCIRQGSQNVLLEVPRILGEPNEEISDYARILFERLIGELRKIDEEIGFYDAEVKRISKNHECCQRLQEITGIGPVTATAIYSSVGDPKVFRNGRQFSAWLGLVPRQCSTGGKPRLLGISKRGDVYLRTLLIHGARTCVRHAMKKDDPRSRWIRGKVQERGMNRTCVAIANKNARIAWALLARGETYQRAA